jgi:hypothetical protein
LSCEATSATRFPVVSVRRDGPVGRSRLTTDVALASEVVFDDSGYRRMPSLAMIAR